jgi:ubiquinone/menaquinone biosynthesis C-methylase UbiE
MLTRARARAGLDVEFVHGKAEHLPFPEATFDVVLLSLVLHELPAPATAIAEAHRVLRDGGRIVVADFGRSTGFAGKARAHLLLHGGVAATAPDPITQLSEGGFTKVQTAPCPVPALAITQGIRLDH